MKAIITALAQQNQMFVEMMQKKKLIVGWIQTDIHEECSHAHDVGF